MADQRQSILDVALAAWDAGMSVIPIRADGSKAPAVPSWKQYQTERAPRAQVEHWFTRDEFTAVAVICGEVSGGLVMLEMEGWGWDDGRWQTFKAEVVSRIGEERWREITTYVELSPSGGPHVYVRCPDFCPAGEKLAMAMRDDQLVVLMETKGEGGYSVIAPSEGHATGKAWAVAKGESITQVVEITPDELAAIREAAQSLDETPERPAPEPPKVSSPGRTPPSESWMDSTIADWNSRFHVFEIVHGWSFHKQDTYAGETVERWHRDGSANDFGAVVFDSGRVMFFSNNCPSGTEPYSGVGVPRTYDAFTLALLAAGGRDTAEDRTAYARELRAQGYGPQPAAAPLETPAPTAETEEPARPALAVRWVDEALSNPPPEPDALVTNLLRCGEVTVLGAPRAIGKTWASLNLAHLLATGAGLMFGAEVFRTLRPAKTLYLQGELGDWSSAARWRMVSQVCPPGMIAEVFERVKIRVTERRVSTVADGTAMTDSYIEAVVDHRLEPTIEALGAEVLVVDPWASFYAGSENSNDETEAAVTALIDIARRTGCAIWIVHHISAKTSHGSLAEPEDLWRGASRLADAVPTRVTVLPHWDARKARELGMDRLDARKFIDIHVLERNGPPVPVQHAQRNGFWWEPWDPPDTDGGRPASVSVRELAAAVRTEGGQVPSKRRLCELLDRSHSAVDRALEQALQLGVLVPMPGGKRGAVGYLLNDEKLP